jgi:hypothetical protein
MMMQLRMSEFARSRTFLLVHLVACPAAKSWEFRLQNRPTVYTTDRPALTTAQIQCRKLLSYSGMMWWRGHDGSSSDLAMRNPWTGSHRSREGRHAMRRLYMIGRQ